MDEHRLNLSLTPVEVEFLAYSIAAHAVWPPDESQVTLLRQVPDGDVAGGPHLRIALLRALVADEPHDLHLELTPSELWLIDSILLQRDLRREKLSDGTPLVELARKIWLRLRDVYQEELPPQLGRDRSDADHDNAHEGAYPDADKAIARAEAILRSRDRKGAG
jgi:hypothetical protein